MLLALYFILLVRIPRVLSPFLDTIFGSYYEEQFLPRIVEDILFIT